ncbi:phosphotransferase family protein [Vibrio ulleungensis]|uniref:Choline kinase n=1 Tax=Vibrio ulleungensis TaxID=2807619 RepID=A0ABS2HFY5_9VIBR|nr:phosphotransferase [Vibrio ulleungensis]MBM7035033.1 choline kinase [Vibrio ulleungensis]
MESKDLSQMGRASVKLAEHEGRPCVIKNNAAITEVAFYKHTAPRLNEVGVVVPEVYEINGNTLVLEYVPHAVSVDELSRSPQTFAQLAAIHEYSEPATHNMHCHHWPLNASLRALASLNLPQESLDAFEHIFAAKHLLFNHQSAISGDSNAGNWARRANGQYVQFDWERFGYGCPTIDLAPLVKGMGTLDDFERVIAHYARFGHANLPANPLRNLIVAKTWIVVEVINLLELRNKPQKNTYIEWYNKVLPSWLNKMAHAL